MALTAGRLLPYRDGDYAPEFAYPVQAGARVYRGSMVVLCSDGTLIPNGAAPAGGATVVDFAGIAEHVQDNTGLGTYPSGLSGPGSVRCRHGVFALPFDAAPTFTNVGSVVYGIDDQTVTLTAGTHQAVGKLVGIDQYGTPWVQV